MQLLHTVAIAPELFQRIALAHLRVKDVDHHAAVVQYQPTACRVTILAAYSVTAFQQLPLHFTRNGLQMRFGCAGADDKTVGHRRDGTDIKDQWILRFLVERNVTAKFGKRVRVGCDGRFSCYFFLG